MLSFLSKYSEQSYAAMRIMAGFMLMWHGISKVFGVLGTTSPEAWTQAWIGGYIEMIGGLLIMIGLQTRVAAFLCSGMMAVAYFQFHWRFQMGAEFLPIVNHGELAVLNCFVFLYIATKGAGRWGVDKG